MSHSESSGSRHHSQKNGSANLSSDARLKPSYSLDLGGVQKVPNGNVGGSRSKALEESDRALKASKTALIEASSLSDPSPAKTTVSEGCLAQERMIKSDQTSSGPFHDYVNVNEFLPADEGGTVGGLDREEVVVKLRKKKSGSEASSKSSRQHSETRV